MFSGLKPGGVRTPHSAPQGGNSEFFFSGRRTPLFLDPPPPFQTFLAETLGLIQFLYECNFTHLEFCLSTSSGYKFQFYNLVIKPSTIFHSKCKFQLHMTKNITIYGKQTPFKLRINFSDILIGSKLA